jgi:MFS family permease
MRSEAKRTSSNLPVNTPGLPALFLLAFLMASGFTVQSFAAVFHLADFHGAGAGLVGRATGIQGLAYLLGCFLFPLLRRDKGITQDFRILFLAAPILATIVLAMTGFATALLWPPLMGVVSSLSEGSGLNRVMARYNLSWTLGPVLMPMIAGALYMRSAFLAFSLATALFAAGGIIYLFFLIFRINAFKNVSNSAKPAIQAVSPEIPEGGITGEHRLTGWILMFADHVVAGLILFILPLSLRADSGLNEFSIGAVTFARFIVMAAGMWLFGHLDFWHFNRKTGPLMIVFYLILLLIMVLFQRVLTVYIVAITLSGLPAAFFYSSGVFHGVAGSENRSGRLAISEAVLTCGSFVGAALGGALYQAKGMPVTFAAAAGILLSGTAAVFITSGMFDSDKIRKKESVI